MAQEQQKPKDIVELLNRDKNLLEALNSYLIDIQFWVSVYRREDIIKERDFDYMITKSRIDKNFRDAFIFAINRVIIIKLGL